MKANPLSNKQYGIWVSARPRALNVIYRHDVTLAYWKAAVAKAKDGLIEACLREIEAKSLINNPLNNAQ